MNKLQIHTLTTAGKAMANHAVQPLLRKLLRWHRHSVKSVLHQRDRVSVRNGGRERERVREREFQRKRECERKRVCV